MPDSINIQEEVTKFIDEALKKAVDEIVFGLEEKYNYDFSPATILTLVLLTTEFTQRFTSTVNSQDLMEPERFERLNER